MARTKKKYESLPYDTPVDVVAVNGDRVIVKPMTFGESLAIKRSKSWRIIAYKKGFHSFKKTE